MQQGTQGTEEWEAPSKVSWLVHQEVELDGLREPDL